MVAPHFVLFAKRAALRSVNRRGVCWRPAPPPLDTATINLYADFIIGRSPCGLRLAQYHRARAITLEALISFPLAGATRAAGLLPKTISFGSSCTAAIRNGRFSRQNRAKIGRSTYTEPTLKLH
jgi:hypothetical protein